MREKRAPTGREPATRERIERLLQELGKRYRGAGRLYLVGGTQKVYAGFRGQTEEIGYTAEIEGDHGEFVAAIRSLIRDLHLSVEPAGPGDFIPLPAGWEQRSRFVGSYGHLDLYTFDPVSLALSKIERGSDRDIDDVLALLAHRELTLEDLRTAFEVILPRLERESLRVDEADFRRKFEGFLRRVRGCERGE